MENETYVWSTAQCGRYFEAEDPKNSRLFILLLANIDVHSVLAMVDGREVQSLLSRYWAESVDERHHDPTSHLNAYILQSVLYFDRSEQFKPSVVSAMSIIG